MLVRSELWDLSLKFVVVRKVMHSTVGLHRVRLLFSSFSFSRLVRSHYG